MKTLLLVVLLVAAAVATPAADESKTAISPSVAKDSLAFEMRTYYPEPGKLEALNARFRDHTCRLFKKHGMEIVGFWIPNEQKDGADTKLVYILVHKSREAAKKSWADFRNDPEWKKASSESEANGRLVEKAESVFMSATDYSPMK